MEDNRKKFFLRIGSNKEKEYVKKMGALFSGLLVRANYFEASPGMLSGIFLKFDSLKSPVGYIIDPVTYVFKLAPDYLHSWQKINKDKAEERLRSDLKFKKNDALPNDWIRKIQNPTKKQKNKVEIFNISKSYRHLANRYFPGNVANIAGNRSVNNSDFDDATISSFVERVISYQKEAITGRYDTSKYSDFKDVIPEPITILSPYFLIENNEDLDLMQKIWREFDSQYRDENGSLVLQCTIGFLENNLKLLLDTLESNQKREIFFWIDGFDEEKASDSHLRAYVEFIEKAFLRGKKVTNLYSGGLTPFLFPFGLTGMVNNIGYGLQREAEPVKGGMPTAQFYIPTLHVREQVLTSYDLFIKNDLGETKEKFYKEICSCPICREGIKRGVIDFIPFYGSVDYPKSNPDSLKKYPTPVALKRCTYHFILSRLTEYKWAKNASKQDVIERIKAETTIWKTNKSHLEKIREILKL